MKRQVARQRSQSWRLKKRSGTKPARPPQIEPHEREASAFWFRRLTTSLLIGNGAGVAAVAALVSKSETIASSAPLAYVPLTYFLTGVACGVATYALTGILAGTRLKTYADWLSERQGKQYFKDAKDASTFQNLAVLSVLALWLLQLVSMIGAAAMFYLGAASAVNALGAEACRGSAAHAFCAAAPTPLFGKQHETSSEVAALSTFNPNSSFILMDLVDRERADGSRYTILNGGAFTKGGQAIEAGYTKVKFRLSRVDAFNRDITCTFEVSNWLSPSTPPFALNPFGERFRRKLLSNQGFISITPLTATIDIHADAGYFGQTRDLTSPDHPLVTKANEVNPDLRGYLDLDAEGGVVLYTAHDAHRRPECISLVHAAGLGTTFADRTQ